MSLEVPTIHLNGTSKKELLQNIDNAFDKLNDAIYALCECAPNGRDYYIGLKAGVTHDRLQQAASEHAKRMSALYLVKSELQYLAEEIHKQGGR